MKGNSAIPLVLIIAAVVLGCFAVKSYFDFKLVELQHTQQSGGNSDAEQAAVGSAGVVPPPPGTGISVATPLATAPAAASSAAAVGVADPAMPGAGAVTVASGMSGAVPEAMNAGLQDDDVAEYKRRLEILEMEQEALRERYERRGIGGASDGGPISTSELPADPPADPKVLATQKKILNAPVIGEVGVCLWELDAITITAGKKNNVRVGDKYAVRHGHEVIGYLEVDVVEDEFAHTMVTLTSHNAEDESARRPEPGDDVIRWPLF